MRILVVEDESKMARFLQKGLVEAQYAVDVAESSAAAESLTAENEYDLIVLDVRLPDLNGIDTARHLRVNGFTGPLLMLTALSSTKDKIRGLDAGADDYLTKPFSFDELLARVRALLRRPRVDTISALRAGDLEMNLVSRNVVRGGNPIQLTPREFALLEFLLRNSSRPVTRTAIGEHVWDLHFDSESNVIDVYVNLLRRKVDAPFKTKLIHTVVGTGYVLEER